MLNRVENLRKSLSINWWINFKKDLLMLLSWKKFSFTQSFAKIYTMISTMIFNNNSLLNSGFCTVSTYTNTTNIIN